MKFNLQNVEIVFNKRAFVDTQVRASLATYNVTAARGWNKRIFILYTYKYKYTKN